MTVLSQLAEFAGKPRPEGLNIRVGVFHPHCKFRSEEHQRDLPLGEVTRLINQGEWIIVKSEEERETFTILVKLKGENVHVVCRPVKKGNGNITMYVMPMTIFVADPEKWEDDGLTLRKRSKLSFDPFADALFEQKRYQDKSKEMEYRKRRMIRR